MTPPAEDDKRNALLLAARELFLKNTYANISIRRIAEKAKVNSALIAYYFGSKSGLFREMIKSYIRENLNRARQSIGYVDRMALREFIQQFYRTMPPEMVHLTVRTMLFERSEMRQWLLDNLIHPAFDTAMAIAETIVDHHDKPIDPLLLRTTLQAFLVMPKLMQPMLEELNPDDINDDFFHRLATFHADLISHYFELEIN